MEREVQVGQLIAGKYRIQQVLGRGGMGVVMAALHEHLNQRVALKFLTDDAYQQPEAVTRFLREARSAVQIQSEHVARVMDVGTLESGAPYMVMEYLPGLDLKEVSTRRGPLPITEAVDFLLQACDAVAEAHSLGIVHRDLKPSNLFLTERPDGTPLVKVLDFGISKALHGGRIGETSKHQMTASAAIMGSPQYMSPEQIRSSKNVDARADIWALGTILHELLAGAPAYTADTVPGLLAMIVADPPPPLSAARPDAPPDLVAVLLRCLQKDRELRFANVAEFARAIERFASPEVRPLVRRIGRVLGEPGATSPSFGTMGGGHTTHEAAVQTHNTWARTGRLHDNGPTPFYLRPTVQLGAGMGLVGVGLLGWFLFARAPHDAAVSPAANTSTTAVVLPPAKAVGPSRPTSSTSGGVRPVHDPAQDGSNVAGGNVAGGNAAGNLPTGSQPNLAGGNALGGNALGGNALGANADGNGVVGSNAAGSGKGVGNGSVGLANGSGRADVPAIDDDPRAARNFQDDPSAYPAANAKKHELAVAARKPKPKPFVAKRALPPVERETVEPDAVSPLPPPKKSNTLDLFNDTK